MAVLTQDVAPPADVVEPTKSTSGTASSCSSSSWEKSCDSSVIIRDLEFDKANLQRDLKELERLLIVSEQKGEESSNRVAQIAEENKNLHAFAAKLERENTKMLSEAVIMKEQLAILERDKKIVEDMYNILAEQYDKAVGKLNGVNSPPTQSRHPNRPPSPTDSSPKSVSTQRQPAEEPEE